MKKFISIVATVTLICAIGTTAFAGTANLNNRYKVLPKLETSRIVVKTTKPAIVTSRPAITTSKPAITASKAAIEARKAAFAAYRTELNLARKNILATMKTNNKIVKEINVLRVELKKAVRNTTSASATSLAALQPLNTSAQAILGVLKDNKGDVKYLAQINKKHIFEKNYAEMTKELKNIENKQIERTASLNTLKDYFVKMLAILK